jgi:hypothetical protein
MLALEKDDASFMTTKAMVLEKFEPGRLAFVAAKVTGYQSSG